MKVIRIFLLGMVVMIGFGCSSIILSDTMKTADFEAVKNQKLLVVCKSEDSAVSKNYEIEIATRLRKIGIDAIERHLKYPQLHGNENPSEDELALIVKMFKEDEVNVVLVTSLKETKERVKIVTEGDNYYPTSTSYGKYNLTFNPDYTQSYMKYDGTNTVEPTVLTSTTYFLEAITYDLTLVMDKQLTSISLVEVTDPEFAIKVRKKFSKIIEKQFRK